MITKQDMIKLALELSFAQIDLELSQLYVDDFDDKLEGRLKKLRMNFYFDSLDYFLDDESLKKIEEYELKQIKTKEATCEKIDYEKILNGLE